MKRLVAIAVIVGLQAGCELPWSGCKEVQRAVATRTFECTGSWELGEGRAQRLVLEGDACPDPDARDGGCAEAIEALSCEEVAGFGDDLDAWLGVDPNCTELFPGASAPVEGSGRPQVSLSDDCPCPGALGAEVEVGFVNLLDVDVRVYPWLVEDCTVSPEGYATVFANRDGTLPMPEGLTYDAKTIDGERIGCFVAEDGIDVILDL